MGASNLRSPPHSAEAEEALLGALLIDPETILNVAPILEPEDFYVRRNGWVYEAVLALHQRRQPIDFLTLCAELEAKGRLEEVGGQAYIARLIEAVPTALHAEAYARRVREAAVRRRMLRFASTIARLAHDADRPLEEALDRIEAESLRLRGEVAFQDRLRPLGEVVREVYDHLEEATRQGTVLGLSTGFPDLDRLLGGFRRGSLVIVGARPGQGKSSLLLSFATAALRAGVPAVLFSLEMSAEEVAHRLLAMEAGIDTVRLQTARLRSDEWPVLAEHAGRLATLPLWVDDTPYLTTGDLRAKARRLYAEHGLGMVLLDYIQLAHPSHRYDSRYQEIGAITRDLKELAQELKVPVIAASQVSRAVEQRASKRPTLADLRESGNQEADADVVIFPHREEADVEGTGPQGVEAAELIVAKHRHGPTGVVHVLWQPERVRFVSATREEVRR
ncbi:MAG TPA: replicative DNA helicase [Thermoflexia bacterium]|jgi:replicative DNA helicase|nr:replicative DNA helicase [Thermoflexia bacterium]